MLKHLIISLRPYQWVKNLLVFAPLVFSISFLKLEAIISSLLAFASFCLISGSIYLLNDVKDRKLDRLHPLKNKRPIASGKISSKVAIIASLILFFCGSLLSLYINIGTFSLILIYVILNVCYSLGLKYIIILDIIIVALGFLIRALTGALAINVSASPWLLTCTFMLALLVVIGKRRSELNLLKNMASDHRKTLEDYNLILLDGLLFICAGAGIITYTLYTMAVETISRFETQWLIGTTPIVIYSIFRYLYLIYAKDEEGDPTRLILRDKPMLISGLLWMISIPVIIYISKVL